MIQAKTDDFFVEVLARLQQSVQHMTPSDIRPSTGLRTEVLTAAEKSS